jgi:hypothetical protein
MARYPLLVPDRSRRGWPAGDRNISPRLARNGPAERTDDSAELRDNKQTQEHKQPPDEAIE